MLKSNKNNYRTRTTKKTFIKEFPTIISVKKLGYKISRLDMTVKEKANIQFCYQSAIMKAILQGKVYLISRNGT